MSALPKPDRSPEEWQAILKAAPLDLFARVWHERAPEEKDAMRAEFVALISAKLKRGEEKVNESGESFYQELSARAIVDLTRVLNDMKEEAMMAQSTDKLGDLRKRLASKGGLKIADVSDLSDE